MLLESQFLSRSDIYTINEIFFLQLKVIVTNFACYFVYTKRVVTALE